jgi:hypothetical protein
MPKEIIVAIIGALATIVAAFLGAGSKASSASANQSAAPAHPSRWRMRGVILGVLVLVIGLLLVGISFGAAEQRRHEELERAANANVLSSSYVKLISQGIGKKPYVMPAVLMLITLELSKDGKSITSDRRTFYYVQALEDLKRDGGSFPEEYHSHWNIEQIAGADNESITEGFESGKVGYNVEFELPKGERHSLLTGAHTVTPLEVPSHRPPVHMFEVGSHDDAYCYPNDQEDIIEELTIVVQSNSLKLSLPGYPDRDAARQNGKQVQYFAPQIFTAQASSNHNSSIVARFRDVRPKEVVGVHIQWGVAELTGSAHTTKSKMKHKS